MLFVNSAVADTAFRPGKAAERPVGAKRGSMEFCDVAVVGAGPAGAMAANRLAQGGARVVLLEKRPLPRGKVCGGGLVRRAAAMLPVDAAPAVELRCRRVEVTIGSRPLRFVAQRSTPVILMIDRRRLDYLLAAEAALRGADLRPQCTVSGLRGTRKHVALQTSRGDMRARFVVAADGASSRVARLAGWHETRRVVPALECSLSLPAWWLERFSRAPGFDFGAVPGGYGWRFSKGGRLDIGVGSLMSSAGNLKVVLGRYLERIGLGDLPTTRLRSAPIPLSPRTDGFVKGRVLLVGDAAGLADPLTAEGLSHALHSGRLAAEALLEAGLDPGRLPSVYHRKLKSEILDELRLARFFARLTFCHPQAVDRLFGRWGQEFVEGVTDIACGRSTYRSLLFNPVNYMRLLIRRS